MKPKVLFFVSVAFLLLVRSASAGCVVSSGTATLQGTYTFSFDVGQEGVAPVSVWWDIESTGPPLVAQMVPYCGAVNLGVVDFDSITLQYLESLTYSTTPIPASQLVAGDVFAVLTCAVPGNYAKVEVLQSGVGPNGDNLVLQWVTTSPSPGPPVYVSTFTSSQILCVDGTTGATNVLFTDTSSTPPTEPEALAVGPDNLIYAADPTNGRIIRIDQSGGSFATVYQYNGSSGPSQPEGLSFSTTGLLTFNDRNENGVWQISFDSSDNPVLPPVQLISSANGAAEGEGTAFNLTDALLIVDLSGNDVLEQTAAGAGTTSTLISSLSYPFGIAVNSSGNIFVANTNNPHLKTSPAFATPGYITQYTSVGTSPSTYVTFPTVVTGSGGPVGQDAPILMQFNAPGNLYVVTNEDPFGDYGRVWGVSPCSSPPCTPTLLVDLGYAYSNGAIPNLEGNTAVGVAVPATGATNSYITPPIPLPTPGTSGTVSSTYGNIINQAMTLPSGWLSGGASYIEVNYQQWNPTVFNTTRLPATSTNAWSGGTPVPAGTTCRLIGGTGGNCIVIEQLCFDENMVPILPCEIFAPTGSFIVLKSEFQTQAPTQYLGMIIGDDYESTSKNDWANITYSTDVTGHTIGSNTDTVIVNLGPTAPAITSADSTTFTYNSAGTFTVTATGAPTPTLSESGPLPGGVSFTDNGDDTATLAGTPTAVGSFPFTITAQNGIDSPATQPFTLTVSPANQTITVTTAPPLTANYGTSFGVAATASSGLVVAITATGVCTVTGTTTTATSTGTVTSATIAMTSGTGSCTVYFNQAGNTNYNAAPQVCPSQPTAAAKIGSTVNIVSNAPNPSAPGQGVVVSFTVTGNGSPTGSVTVSASTGESCTGGLTPGAPSAGSCSLTFFTVGSRTLTAYYSGDLNFSLSASTTTVTQTVNGPLASVLPSSVNFGTVYLGTITVKSVTVTNVGNAPMTITTPFFSILSGGDPSEFAEVNLCPKSLPAGKSCTIEVAFAAGPYYTLQTATLSVTDSAYNSPQTVTLTATVINPQAWLSAWSLSFGTVSVGTPSAAQAVTLKNTGTTTLTITGIALAGADPNDFSETNTCLPPVNPSGTLGAGTSCTINVTFTPQAKGSRSGKVVITDNALLSPQVISLSGKGD